MKKNARRTITLLIAITVMVSCKKDNLLDDRMVSCVRDYEKGYFITNEGNFEKGNGSVSFVTDDGVVSNDVFSCINSFALGDVVQSMSIIDNNAYIIVNGSSKIEVASVDSMLSILTIEGLVSPRYIVQVNEENAYVTDWGIDGVHVIDLITKTILSTIDCGKGPEGIVVSNGFAYVCNVGGWELDNTITVINTTTNTVETTLTVGDKPSSVVVDVNGTVWVLTEGYTEYDDNWNVVSETAGSLVQISDNVVVANYIFDIGNHPEDLVINDLGTTLYYSDGSWSKAVYAFDINATELPTTALINKSFYALGTHNGYIYGTDAVDFTQSGWSFSYTEDGNVIDSFQVGLIPGGYCFQ